MNYFYVMHTSHICTLCFHFNSLCAASRPADRPEVYHEGHGSSAADRPAALLCHPHVRHHRSGVLQRQTALHLHGTAWNTGYTQTHCICLYMYSTQDLYLYRMCIICTSTVYEELISGAAFSIVDSCLCSTYIHNHTRTDISLHYFREEIKEIEM